MSTEPNLSLANSQDGSLNLQQKLSLVVSGLGVLLLFIAWGGVSLVQSDVLLIFSLVSMTFGGLWYGYATYAHLPPGIKNDGNFFKSLTARGALAWMFGIVLTGFYVLLYWFPGWIGYKAEGTSEGLVAFFEPLSQWLRDLPADQWFVYGTLYTVAILGMGFKFLYKYRHSTYQMVRTGSVMFFQLAFAFLIPYLMEALNKQTATKWFGKDMKNMWPLDYDFFDQWHMDNMLDGGWIGITMLVSGLAMIFIVMPILTYFFGKRWYCSWVCGCGGLAETAGDPFRHLSDNSLFAWQIERWVVHGVLLFSVVMSTAVVYSYLGSDPDKYYLTQGDFTWIVIALMLFVGGTFLWFQRNHKKFQQKAIYLVSGTIALVVIVLLANYSSGAGKAFFIDAYKLKQWYGFGIGAVFSGVVGVGFYPLLGNRVWCRFGCPLAAILGFQQKLFSRFRITTNGSQCISCGNCSTYCEMGIDVRWYAQRGQDIVRSSCVGCGICSEVCPRGVLKLENGPEIDMRAEQTRTVHVPVDNGNS